MAGGLLCHAVPGGPSFRSGSGARVGPGSYLLGWGRGAGLGAPFVLAGGPQPTPPFGLVTRQSKSLVPATLECPLPASRGSSVTGSVDDPHMLASFCRCFRGRTGRTPPRDVLERPCPTRHPRSAEMTLPLALWRAQRGWGRYAGPGALGVPAASWTQRWAPQERAMAPSGCRLGGRALREGGGGLRRARARSSPSAGAGPAIGALPGSCAAVD